ncbi:hypothetical protein M231_01799 [Tremella mesenterica]|uniref:Micro-fibrillar-associated protein 1 C-terminal domain-containing protein n=1 Tax=Tremella mesenterica TaxID=5217 RepID=A0A4Q1BSD9_TREME|nr:hypothetical protein M231_01799 [Tremella mesenterica]
MAPPTTAKRPLVKPPKVRYFKNKPLADVPSDSDESGDEAPVQQEPIKVDPNLVAGGAGRLITSKDLKSQPQMKVALRDVKVEGGKLLIGGEVGRPMRPPVKKEEEEEEEESSEEEEEEEDAKPAPGEESSEYETDSEEEEEVKKPVFRPVFIKKENRGMTQEKAAAMAEEAARKEEELREQRKLDSKDLAGETIRRELAEKEATDLQPEVDDTDGLDPAAEFEEWRARELARLLRDKQAQAAKDEEKEEIERRRAMPEEQRLKEDLEYAEATRAKEKGQMGFLQKYYHRGAFHLDDDLLNRDYTLATENAVDMSMLPKVLQVRDYGKMSRSKYTHLADQDTSQGGWGTAARAGPAVPGAMGTNNTGCWNCGGPHLRKDCPNNNLDDPMRGLGPPGQGTSANSSALGHGVASGPPGTVGGRRYGEEGRERRFEEERRADRGYSGRRDHQGDQRDRGSHRGTERDRANYPASAPGNERDRRDDYTGYDGNDQRGKGGHHDRFQDYDRGSDRPDNGRHDRDGRERGDKKGERRKSRSRSRSPRRERDRR